MIICTGLNIDADIVYSNLTRIQGQIFKLLPMNEENQDWIKPLETLVIEVSGLNSLLGDQKDTLALICKLKGLREQGEDIDFMLFRRTIFETCSLVESIKKQLDKDLYL